MHRLLDNCRFVSFSYVWLEKLVCEVRLCQVDTDSSAQILLGRYSVVVFAVRPSKRTPYYVGVDAFDLRPFHCQRFLVIPTHTPLPTTLEMLMSPTTATYYGPWICRNLALVRSCKSCIPHTTV